MKRSSHLLESAREATSALKTGDAGFEDFDSQGRRWPTLPIKPQLRVEDSRGRDEEMAAAVESIASQLARRCAQVAELHDTSDRQITDLNAACDEIDRLSKVVFELDALVTQSDATIARRDAEIWKLLQENSAQLKELNAYRQESDMLSQKLLTLQTDFNNQNMTIVSIQEKCDQTTQELALVQAEKEQLRRLHEGSILSNQSELDISKQKMVQELTKAAQALNLKNEKIRKLESSEAHLIDRCQTLVKLASQYKQERADVQNKYESDAIEVIETVCRIEKQALTDKIDALQSELQFQRLKTLSIDKTLAGGQEKIVPFLPKSPAIQLDGRVLEKTSSLSRASPR